MARRPLLGVRIHKAEIPPYGEASCAPVIAPGRRVQTCVTRPAKPSAQIQTPEDACKLLKGAVAADRESMYAIHLDNQNRAIGVEEIAKGTIAAVETAPREVFKGAILTNAASVILAHNHPSGNPDPSQADITFTKRIIAAGDIVGVPVRDHVIVAAEGCTSLRSRGLVTGFSGAEPRRKR